MLSAEMQNAKMAEERAFASKLFESALEGRTATLVSLVTEYAAKKHVSSIQILSQFKDASKRTVLHFACQSHPLKADDESDIVIDLLSLNNRITITSPLKLTSSCFETLLKMKDKDGLNPLMLAAQNVHHKYALARIQAILQAGGTHVALARAHSGGTALHYAASAGASRDILMAIFQAAPVAIRTKSLKGGTPLHWAAGVSPPNNFTSTIETLIDLCGADMDASDQEEGLIPSILSQNLDMQSSGVVAMTPCILAAAAANDAHAKFLVQKGARRDVLLPGHFTLFHMAADLNLVGTLAALLLDIPDSNTTSNTDMTKVISTCLSTKTLDKHCTPLDLAVLEGHLRCVMLLLDEPDEDKARVYMEQRKQELEDQHILLSTQNDVSTSLQDIQKNHSNNNPFSEEAAQTHVQSLSSSSSTTPQDFSEDAKFQAHTYKAQGNTFFANKQYPQALESYTQAIDTFPLDETFYSNRSACYMALQNPNQALYDAAITRYLKPTWAKGWYRLAVAQLALEMFEEAAMSAWEGLRLDPENAELKSLLQKCVKKGRKEHFESK